MKLQYRGLNPIARRKAYAKKHHDKIKKEEREALYELLKVVTPWEGTVSELKKAIAWPANAHSLAMSIRGAKDTLASKGMHVHIGPAKSGIPSRWSITLAQPSDTEDTTLGDFNILFDASKHKQESKMTNNESDTNESDTGVEVRWTMSTEAFKALCAVIQTMAGGHQHKEDIRPLRV
jgi:hypothetical protein